MDNQHKLIRGYRDLTPAEIEAMNRGKDLAEDVGRWLDEIIMEGKFSPDLRWLAIGRTQLQQGFMAAIRGIARPSTF